MTPQQLEVDQSEGVRRKDPIRKPMQRRTVDYGSGITRWFQERTRMTSFKDARYMFPKQNFIVDLLPPFAYKYNPSLNLPIKYIHSSSNKVKHPVNVVKWTPDGRRLLTGSSSGEFTLWNGLTFNFETILQAHDHAIRSCEWSNSGDFFLSSDQSGIVKYWQPNMNNVKVLNAHSEAVRDISFSPTDNKFATASDDGCIKIWNFTEAHEEQKLTGHGWDVRTIDWHPSKGLLVSGSKDNLVKLWDPRSGKCLTTLHGHKNTVYQATFQPTHGDLLATCSRDSITRIFDIRTMKDLRILRGHEKDVTSLAWNPIIPSILSTGGANGVINHYIIDEFCLSENSQTKASISFSTPSLLCNPTVSIPYAHESSIWSMQYHPLGHILATGSNDRYTRFWARARPGDPIAFKDKYYIGEEAAEALGIIEKMPKKIQEEEEEEEADILTEQNESHLFQQHTNSTEQSPKSQNFILPGLQALSTLKNQNDFSTISSYSHFIPPGLASMSSEKNMQNLLRISANSNIIPGMGNTSIKNP
ncbi:hypothetical protein PNEG_00227 [Pneumocystis murina B123]|uniref:Polyadenylation factor subunit 2 n=1 Tax=Pneumocystis murina (strain B123) TaxID=1069680 RepID=M7NXB5_PNEMU|nr:hypothetical protein PNEG_00227 [Pneumocystis murina B123]EMR11801.1 hypothetical protein PNEG_00227 [Pneumocystis murina B123]